MRWPRSLAALACVLLSACGSSGAPVTANEAAPVANNSAYTGPAPAAADVQAFSVSFWSLPWSFESSLCRNPLSALMALSVLCLILSEARSVKPSGVGVGVTMARLAVGGGARVVATMVYVAPDAADKLDAVRAALAPAEAGASVWNGMLIVRILGIDSASVRRTVIAALVVLRACRPLPRVWLC